MTKHNLSIHTSIIALGLILLGFVPLSADGVIWTEAPQFELLVNGKTDLTARIYQPQQYKPLMLIVSREFKSPILLDLKARTYGEVKMAPVSSSEDISITLPDIIKAANPKPYTVTKGVTAFTLAGKSVKIKYKESLVGEVSLGILLAHSPVYKLLRDKYKPNPNDIKKLKQLKKKTDVVCLFATWCPTCKLTVPRFLKIMQLVNKGTYNIRYIGIAMGGSEPAHFLEKYGHDYPAFIFFRNGKEIGRITGNPVRSLEREMYEILKK
ncbi:MAG: thioredoxin family protein [Chlorobi bacterium]|nr:thioredoxin family protein [Chlorobiota bacterium]